jgi:hypothetical protein
MVGHFQHSNQDAGYFQGMTPGGGAGRGRDVDFDGALRYGFLR